jgi:hypothetical protein
MLRTDGGFKWACGYSVARGAPRSCWLALKDAAVQLGIPVFVDSGAYGEFGKKESIPPVMWRAMLADQLELARIIGPLAVLVLPDKVGDQAGTLRRLRKYSPEINAILDTGARGIVALQPGPLSDAQMAREIASALGRKDWLVGFPTTARARRDPAEIRHTLETFPWTPRGVHLLGIGPAAAAWPEYLAALAPLPADAWASSDAVLVRRLVGRAHVDPSGRERPLGALTQQEDIARAELLEEAWGGVSDPLARASLDPTEQLPDPSGWLPAGEARRIGRAGVQAGLLTPQEAVAFAADPTLGLREVQGRDEPGAEWWLEQEIERAWWAQIHARTHGLATQLRKERGRRALLGEHPPTPELVPELSQMEFGVGPMREPKENPMRTFSDSPNVAVVVVQEKGPRGAAPRDYPHFTLLDPTRPEYLASGEYEDAVVAALTISQDPRDVVAEAGFPRGFRIYSVGLAAARRGYGPLAYEVALEYARRHNGAVMPGEEVSESATRVWQRFAERPYQELYPEAIPADWWGTGGGQTKKR